MVEALRLLLFTSFLRRLLFLQFMLSLAQATNANNGLSNSIVGLWSNAGAVTVAVTAIAGVVLAGTIIYTQRGRLKSPWSQRKKRLSPEQWRSLFTEDGKLFDGGVMLLKKVRSGGIDPNIRAEVWPFLLGLKEYEKLRKKCRRLLWSNEDSNRIFACSQENGPRANPDVDHSGLKNVANIAHTSNFEEDTGFTDPKDNKSISILRKPDDSSADQKRETDGSEVQNVSSSMDNSEESDAGNDSPTMQNREESIQITPSQQTSPLIKTNIRSKLRESEDFSTWQRIIRLDAVRANSEWVDYAPSLATVSVDSAHRSAEAVGLKDYDHLEPFRIFHAARLVAILEAYAVYDPEIGYCQGMSDLLSPLITVLEDDSVAFWCFVGFMRKARHNFRLDEVGIRRQLNIVSKIIKCKDSHLFNHLAQLQVEDCFFVYRMVVVLFRRELNFEQTLSLWEVMWADQTAIRAGIGKSTWSKIRLGVPPTEDLLLYAIAASVLQRRKLIIERYNSMEDIIRECNNMAGHLDVWKLLDDAHNLVMSLHDKIET
uniref:Rab-GAP TBC domain-containing protein n=1 Tax=Kalanchoe fedtschenkoi TaxID=63787 RepID=A0A7N0SVU9_KALFE